MIDDDAKNSSFSVEITGSGLEVTSATAKIPAQTISEIGTIDLASDSNKVVLATIAAGKLVIDIDNYMAITSEMNLYIPSLKTPDGSNFQTSINIGANSSNLISETNISGYALSMSIDEQSVDYSYDVTTQDSGEDFIVITSTDSIIVNIRKFFFAGQACILMKQLARPKSTNKLSASRPQQLTCIGFCRSEPSLL